MVIGGLECVWDIGKLFDFLIYLFYVTDIIFIIEQVRNCCSYVLDLCIYVHTYYSNVGWVQMEIMKKIKLQSLSIQL